MIAAVESQTCFSVTAALLYLCSVLYGWRIKDKAVHRMLYAFLRTIPLENLDPRRAHGPTAVRYLARLDHLVNAGDMYPTLLIFALAIPNQGTSFVKATICASISHVYQELKHIVTHKYWSQNFETTEVRLCNANDRACR